MLDMPPQEIVCTLNKGNIALPLCGIVIPPKNEKNLPYDKLQRSAEDEQNIFKLISALGSYSYLDLLVKEKQIRKLGDALRPIHPFRFLEYIYTTPELKDYMKNILADFIIKKEFMSGISEALTLYYQTRRLSMYINDFANNLRVPANQIESYVNAKDWSGLISFLTNY